MASSTMAASVGDLFGVASGVLNLRDEFHQLLADADAKLLGGTGIVLCHCYWVGLSEVFQGTPPAPAAVRIGTTESDGYGF